MNKINRMLVGLSLALVALFAVLPTITTASADTYSTSGSNDGAKDAAYVVGSVAVLGTVLYLVGGKKSGGGTMTSGQ